MPKTNTELIQELSATVTEHTATLSQLRSELGRLEKVLDEHVAGAESHWQQEVPKGTRNEMQN